MTALGPGLKFSVTLVIDISPAMWREVTGFDGADDDVPASVKEYVWSLVSGEGRFSDVATAGAGVSLQGFRDHTSERFM